MPRWLDPTGCKDQGLEGPFGKLYSPPFQGIGITHKKKVPHPSGAGVRDLAIHARHKTCLREGDLVLFPGLDDVIIIPGSIKSTKLRACFREFVDATVSGDLRRCVRLCTSFIHSCTDAV